MNTIGVNPVAFRCLFATCLLAVALPGSPSAGVYPDTPERLWPDGIIPFQYTMDVNANQQCCVQLAMDVWEAEANLQFVARTNESDFLQIQQGTSGPNYPPPEGYRSGDGAHILNLNVWCSMAANCPATISAPAVFGLVHELGHALGLYHSHQRTDRDNHVFVDISLVTAGNEGNYAIANDSLKWPPNEMDIDSIMSYPLCTFSTCMASCPMDLANCAPITLLPPYDVQWSGMEICPTMQSAGDLCVGQRNHLSQLDALLMSFLYPEPNWRFVDGSYQGMDVTGSFYYPFKTFADGKADVPAGGTLWIQPGDYPAPGLHEKAMVIESPLGGVILGD